MSARRWASPNHAPGPPLGHHEGVNEPVRPTESDGAKSDGAEPKASHPSQTEPEPAAGRPMTMADYEEAMTERAQAARARGLAAPYIAGGRDPDPERGRREERFYLRLLVAMVAAIVLGGFAISILYLILTGGR